MKTEEAKIDAQPEVAPKAAEPIAPAVPKIGTMVVFRHPGPAYAKGKEFYVPAVVLGSNPDGTINLYAFTDHSPASEVASYGPGVGQYQSVDEAVEAMSKAAEAKSKAETLKAKVASDLAAKQAEEAKKAELIAK